MTFERTYYTLFGSQIYIVDFLNTNFDQTKETLKIFYDEAAQKNSEFFKNYTYDDYFDYILDHELVAINDKGNCVITWTAVTF
jgi:hypothetical protein